MKKLLATFACGAFAFACAAMPVSAAADPEINTPESELLMLVEKGVSMSGGSISYAPGSDEYETLKAYVSMEGFDLRASELETIKNSVKDIQAFMNEHGEEEATTELVAQLVNLAMPGAEALDMKLSYDPLTDTITIADTQGNVIMEMDNAFDLAQNVTTPETKPAPKLENTGEDFTSTYAILGSLVAMLAGAGYMTLKKKESLN